MDECDEDADGDGAAEHAAAADPDDQGNGDGGEQLDRGVVEGVGEDCVFESDQVGVVYRFEVVEGALFPAEELHDAHAGDMLLGKGVDARNGGANAAVGVAHAVAEDAGDEQDDRQHGKGDQCQPPTHSQHDHHNADQHEDIFKDREDAGGEHLVEGVYVGGESRNKAAYRIAVEEGDVHSLQVAEDLRAHVIHDLLAGPLHEVGLGELEHVGEAECADVDEGDLGDAGGGRRAEMAGQPSGLGTAIHGVVGHVAIDGDLGEVGAKDIRKRLEDDGSEGDAGLPLVGAQVLEQTAHQPAVIRLADDVVFVGGGLHLRLLFRVELLLAAGPGF